MPMFPALTFRRAVTLPERVRAAVPRRFVAVAEALAGHTDVLGACSVVGGDVVGDGAALAEALEDLRSTYRLVRGTPPPISAVEALAVAWSEATLQYLHDLSCEDPLTGLASLAHLRSRLEEIHRDAELSDVAVPASHALVLVEVRFPVRTDLRGPFTRALHLTQVAEAMRAVFCGGQTLGRLGPDRAAALVPRDPDLAVSIGLLRDLLSDLDLDDAGLRVWVEGLPEDPHATESLLDELAR